VFEIYLELARFSSGGEISLVFRCTSTDLRSQRSWLARGCQL